MTTFRNLEQFKSRESNQIQSKAMFETASVEKKSDEVKSETNKFVMDEYNKARNVFKSREWPVLPKLHQPDRFSDPIMESRNQNERIMAASSNQDIVR